LHQAHGIPLEKAWFACHFLSSGQLGFWGR
jgi:hypothetical protein